LGKPSGVITCIWELRLKPDVKWLGSILWEAYAERMETAKGEYVVLSIAAAQSVLNQGKRCFLREYSSAFPNRPSG
jgi:hypothetical protein